MFAGGRPTIAAAAILAAAFLAACVTTTTVTYLPSAEQPRLTLADGERTLAQFVGVECERLIAADRDSGSAIARLALDSAGAALSAELRQPSGDTRIDGIVGAVAAQLHLDRVPASRSAEILATWRCAGASPGTTLERLPDPGPPG